MSTLTGKQAKKLIEIFEDTTSEVFQRLIASGFLTDLRDANIDQIGRADFRFALSLLKKEGFLDLLRDVFVGTHEIKEIEGVINLDAPVRWGVPDPTPGCYTRERQPSRGGLAKLEKHLDSLYLDGKKICLFQSEEQQNAPSWSTTYEQLMSVFNESGKQGISAKVLDYLVEHPQLWPQEWKQDDFWVFFTADTFLHTGSRESLVLGGYWVRRRGGEGVVASDYMWIHRHGRTTVSQNYHIAYLEA